MRLIGILTLLVSATAFAATKGATADLKDAQGKDVGVLKIKAVKDGVEITGKIAGLPDGAHAIHIHAVGTCTAPDFKSAGPHFNPEKKQHGTLNPQGHHAGDLPNLTVAKGKAKVKIEAKGVTLADTGDNSLFHTGGTALVVHAKADDYKSDPAGNAGDRIACGVITK
jgi:superoxide dismutase, Cu-Zn family